MQDAKEDSSWFERNIKKKIRDWESKALFKARSFEYFFLWVALAFIVYIAFAYFDLLHTDVNSARYMLSALVQSQAAIIAIVVSLTLIAVQLTASTYSPRVTRIFRDNPDMWILLFMYGFSIFYGLSILKQIPGGEEPLTISLEAYIIWVYALGISTFAILYLYVWNILGLLTSETIINRLAAEITKDSLLNLEEDPIQPILDIVHGSILRYDLATTRFGLKTLTDQIVGLIDTELAADDDHEAAVTVLDNRFCTPVVFAGKLAVNRDDEKSTVEVIKNLQRFGESVVKKVTDEFAELERAAYATVYSLGELGRAAVEKGLEYTAWRAAYSLEELECAAVEKKELEDAADRAAWSLGELGCAAAEEGLKKVARQAAHSLGVVGLAAIRKGLEFVIGSGSLIYLGVVNLKSGLQDAATIAARSLAELALVKKELVEKAFQAFKSELETEEDHNAFHEFMALFNKELEELRKEKEKKN